MNKTIIYTIMFFILIILSSSVYALTYPTTERYFNKNWDGYGTTTIVDYSNVTNATGAQAGDWSTSIPTYSAYTPVAHSYNCSANGRVTMDTINTLSETSSFSFWVKPNSDYTYGVTVRGESDLIGDDWNYFYWSPGNMQFEYDTYSGGSSIVVCDASLVAGTWYNIFVDVGINAGETNIYVNNVWCGTGVSQASNNPGYDLGFCADGGNNYLFDGLITDMKFWSSRQDSATLREKILDGSYWANPYITDERYFDKNWDGYTTTTLVDYMNITNATITNSAGWSTSIPTYSNCSPVSHSFNCTYEINTGKDTLSNTSSFSLWIKPGYDLTYGVTNVGEKDLITDGWNYLYWGSTMQLEYDTYSDGIGSSIVACNASFTKGTWYNIFVDIGTGAGETKIYVNNVLCGSGVSQASDNPAQSILFCGKTGDGNLFDGLITDMKFWSSRQDNATLRENIIDGSYWNCMPTIYYAIRGTIKYNAVALPGAWVELKNFTSNATIATTLSNSTGGYSFLSATYEAIKLYSTWLINVWYSNSTHFLAGHDYKNVTVEET